MPKEMTEKRRAAYDRMKADGSFARAGRKGGLAKFAKVGSEGMSEIAKKGGDAMVAKYGKEFFSKIGKIHKPSLEGQSDV